MNSKGKVVLIALITLTFIMMLSACDMVSIDLTLDANGGEFDSGDSTYVITTDGTSTVTIPTNPTRDGYTFDGWYWDKDVWEQPFTANSLLDAPIQSDMTVYAKWAEGEETESSTSDIITIETKREEAIDSINQYAIEEALYISDSYSSQVVSILDVNTILINSSLNENNIHKIKLKCIYQIDLVLLEDWYTNKNTEIDEKYDNSINQKQLDILYYSQKDIYSGNEVEYLEEKAYLEQEVSNANREYLDVSNPYGCFAEQLSNQGISWNSGYAIHIRNNAKTEYDRNVADLNSLKNSWDNTIDYNNAVNNYNNLIATKDNELQTAFDFYNNQVAFINTQINALE